MANTLSKQITQEGPRNAVVKLTGVLDTSDITEAPAILLSDFINNDTNAGPLTGFRVDLIEYSISNGVEIILEWNATTPRIIYPLAGRGRIDSWNYGGLPPVPGDAGYNGNINLRTVGWTGPVQTFVVILELIKLYSV